MSRDEFGFRSFEPLVETLLVGFAGLTVAVVLLIVTFIPLSSLGVPVDDISVVLPMTIVIQAVGFGLTAAGYLRYRGFDVSYLRINRPSRRDLLLTVAGVGALFAVLVIIDAVVSLFDIAQPAEHEIVGIAQQDPEILLVLIPLAILFIGPGEELLFRGIIQTRLVDAYGETLGILVTSFVFALAHIPAYAGDGTLFSITVLTLLSLILGWLYEHTDNLVVPVLVHGLYDAVLFLFLYLSLTGLL